MVKPMPASVTLSRGSLYLTSELYRRYFDGLETVILLRGNDDLMIMPVRHTAAGGYLMKLKNAVGDRVVNAMDFFRLHGIDETSEINLIVNWHTESAALIASNAFKSAN
jgi:hypothetical protein